MCGIVGIVSKNNVVTKVVEGLKKLEYRGYDSAGISIIKNSEIHTVKKEGKIKNLEGAIVKNKNFDSNIAIGHTRWATHGKPSEENSHPHSSYNISVVHNGIIENYQDIKEKLTKIGVRFASQTDTEVIPHLISFYLERYENDIKKAVFSTLKDLRGAFALGIIFKDQPNLLIGAKKGSPLIIGFGKEENYIASDYFALENFTNHFSYLADGDIVFVKQNTVEIFDSKHELVSRKIEENTKKTKASSKGQYEHFMLKEIFEQPRVVQDSLNQYLDVKDQKINLPNFPFDLNEFDKITIVACGTSFYAAKAAKYLIESLVRINVDIDIASEFRYRDAIFTQKNLMIFISQSGETADTIAALKFAKENNQKILSVVNVANSTMEHLSDGVIRTLAGAEIGVASTKAFTAQLMVLVLFAIKMAEIKKTISPENKKELITEIDQIPNYMDIILSAKSLENIKSIAKYLSKKQSIIYTGRGISYPIALEGALKLKELTYIPAQGIASGELKHGTIALIDKNTPVIVIAPNNKLFEKSASNVEEIVARDGKVILISDQEGIDRLQNIIFKSIALPKNNSIICELLLGAIPTQLIAYYTSLFKGNDVDQPRNLAKSVTVE